MKCLTIQINKRNKALSQFKNYTFNSLVKFGPHYLGSSPSGLFKLGGSSDAGTAIAWAFTPAETDFGKDCTKHIRYMYYGVNTASDIALSAIPDNGDAVEYTIAVPDGGLQRAKISLRSDHLGRYWKFEFSGTTDFDMEDIQILMVNLHDGHK